MHHVGGDVLSTINFEGCLTIVGRCGAQAGPAFNPTYSLTSGPPPVPHSLSITARRPHAPEPRATRSPRRSLPRMRLQPELRSPLSRACAHLHSNRRASPCIFIRAPLPCLVPAGASPRGHEAHAAQVRTSVDLAYTLARPRRFCPAHAMATVTLPPSTTQPF
jgi:hypothetical protein